MTRKIGILRLDHREQRDQRITTHVGLTARGFGCSSFAYGGVKDENLEQSLTKVAQHWGGIFDVEYVTSISQYIKKWDGITVHLTMYGEHHKDTIRSLKKLPDENILIIVGGAKVPPYVYKLADFNTAIGLQPHSEISAIAIFLTDFLGSETLYQEFPNAKNKLSVGTKATRKEKFKDI
jgi:tRNA (cytidine56-2'-O)-methyltransferase